VEIDPDTGKDRTLIYADTAVEVPLSRYYRRRITKGDLVVVTPTRVTSPGVPMSSNRSDKEEG